MKAAERAFASAGIAGRLEADDRRKAEPLGAIDDTRLACQLGLPLAHHVPDIAVDAAALRETGCDRPNHIPVAVGEKEIAEEVGRGRMPKSPGDSE